MSCQGSENRPYLTFEQTFNYNSCAQKDSRACKRDDWPPRRWSTEVSVILDSVSRTRECRDDRVDATRRSDGGLFLRRWKSGLDGVTLMTMQAGGARWRSVVTVDQFDQNLSGSNNISARRLRRHTRRCVANLYGGPIPKSNARNLDVGQLNRRDVSTRARFHGRIMIDATDRCAHTSAATRRATSFRTDRNRTGCSCADR
jgi:hypothetical protein